MPTDYTGNPASFPTTIQIPDDDENEDAASVGVGMEGLADQAAWLKAHLPILHSVVDTADNTRVVPADVTRMEFSGVGGGGGGGGSGSSITSAGNAGMSGGSGGGAKRGRIVKTVVPGETITYAITGTGGTGGAAAAAGTNAGSDGGHGVDVTVTGSTSGLLATFRGAQGGMGGRGSANGSKIAFGGLPAKPIVGDSIQYGPDTAVAPPYALAGQGGSTSASTTTTRLLRNGGCTHVAEGGAGVDIGANSTTGGGASEWPGGVGGAGAANAGTGNPGNPGNAGTLGSGGSGGGGGNNGAIGGFSQVGGAGAAGGDGAVETTWVSPP